jgi:hypothetical protein
VQHYDELTSFTVSSATGSFAQSSNTVSRLSTPSIQGSTPIPVSHRVRTRRVLLRSDSEPEKKRIKITLQEEAIKLIVSVLKDQQSGRRVCFNIVELAIQLL